MKKKEIPDIASGSEVRKKREKSKRHLKKEKKG